MFIQLNIHILNTTHGRQGISWHVVADNSTNTSNKILADLKKIFLGWCELYTLSAEEKNKINKKYTFWFIDFYTLWKAFFWLKVSILSIKESVQKKIESVRMLIPPLDPHPPNPPPYCERLRLHFFYAFFKDYLGL